MPTGDPPPPHLFHGRRHPHDQSRRLQPGRLQPDVEAWSRSLETGGIHPVNREPRRGVEGWKLVDLEIKDSFGMMLQWVEEASD